MVRISPHKSRDSNLNKMTDFQFVIHYHTAFEAVRVTESVVSSTTNKVQQEQQFGECLLYSICSLNEDALLPFRGVNLWTIIRELLIRNPGLLDFVYRPVFEIVKNATFRELCFRPQVRGETTRSCVLQKELTVRAALSKGPNRVGVSPLTWGRKHIHFPKRWFSSF
jgi:hypothetical protein